MLELLSTIPLQPSFNVSLNRWDQRSAENAFALCQQSRYAYRCSTYCQLFDQTEEFKRLNCNSHHMNAFKVFKTLLWKVPPCQAKLHSVYTTNSFAEIGIPATPSYKDQMQLPHVFPKKLFLLILAQILSPVPIKCHSCSWLKKRAKSDFHHICFPYYYPY